MKTVKIKFVGFWNGFNPEYNIIYKTLKKYYNVEICEDPDYIICSVFPDHNGNLYEYCNYSQIRILYSGENYSPDFNLVDYAISPYPIVFLDRHLYYPGCLNFAFKKNEEIIQLNREFDPSVLSEKQYFANFIYSHESEGGLRGEFFEKLSKYKRIESPGTYLNNTSIIVTREDGSKEAFQKKCKFSICFESTIHEGFVTEKIAEAFLSATIPIYLGSSTVKSIFNEKAFINCLDYDSFDDVIDKIIELDNDNEKYLEMLCQPIFAHPSVFIDKVQEAEKFICHIFDQPIEKARRRCQVYAPKKHELFICRKLLTSGESKAKRKWSIKSIAKRFLRG